MPVYNMNNMNALVTQFRPIDDVEQDLIESWRDVSQTTFRFLELLREFDLRQGWKEWGSADCADWLNLKCGITRNTAQEKVRVAHGLWTLPQIEEAFKRGDLSYSKVRAITRVASEVNETSILDYALGATAAQLEGYCRRLRNGEARSTADANRVHAGRSLSRHFRENGSGILTVELAREDLELVLKALEQAAKSLPDMHDFEEQSLFARAADALVQMARESLTGPAHVDDESDSSGSARSSADHTQVVVHVGASALFGDQSDLPIESVRRLCCDGSMVPIVTNAQGEPLNIGRKQRTVPTAIRRALLARDRTCTFPGCSHERWIDAHHIKHWADGGETSLANTILLCSYHRRLVHEGGFTIETRRDGTRFFIRPDGRPVEVTGGKFGRRGNNEIAENGSTGEVKEPNAAYIIRSAHLCELSSSLSAESHIGAARKLTCVPGV